MNIFGIAGAYILGPLLVQDSVHGKDLPQLLEVIAIACAVCALLVTIYFPERPPSPPSVVTDLIALQRQSFSRPHLFQLKVAEVKLREFIANQVPQAALLQCTRTHAYLQTLHTNSIPIFQVFIVLQPCTS
jgi:hypothetical protein